jgi:signal transduction histidine kinase
MNLASSTRGMDRRALQIAERARLIAKEIKGKDPKVDDNVVFLAARLRRSRFDSSLDGAERLSESDYEKAISCFKESAMFAARLLRGSLGPERAQLVGRIIEDHLEHFDGSGPCGKSGEDVLVEAYILNLSVAMQNMMEGMPNINGHDESASVLDNLISLVGSQYPPAVISSALKVISDQMGQAEDPELLRMAAFGRISSGVFHDMDNYLMQIAANLEFLRMGIGQDDHATTEGHVDACLALILEMKRRREEMLDMARADAVRIEADINMLMDTALELVGCKVRHAVVVKHYGKLPKVPLFASGTIHLFANLLANAGQATFGRKGIISIHTLASDEKAVILISDNGQGMDGEVMGSLMAGITTKEEGHGIGLPFCRYIVDRHGGDISFESLQGRGTTVRIEIPLRPEE